MSSLPTGTVTFLFTDIEGSTKLAQEHPATWESARQRHHAILHEATKAHQGYVFQVIGDAFCVAFSTAVDALAAAVDAQHALQAEAWGETSIRVRTGLHTGSADARDGDYYGYLTLAHVQRVMSTAYGSQTLVSNATAGLLIGQLPNGVTLRDMGEHRLKGLPNPEHLWQLLAPGLGADFPPLQSLDTIPNNLPIQVTSFVGREHELGELQRLLPTTRLLTLTGSGGTGKTRLSLQLAAEVLDNFKDGVWFTEFAPLADATLVPQTVATALGMREEPGRPLLAMLMDWLRPKQLLLILDNCEHLIDACAKFADAVLHAGHGTQILASSREALGIAGETAYRVPSLAVPRPTDHVSVEQLTQYAAVTLFIERARQSLTSFRVTAANAPTVAQICYRLDGIPLAIELAASRVKALSVEQIAERLDDRFRLLTGGSRTALPRQQTLRALVDWSYELLSRDERMLLRRLSVFAGGWTLKAPQAACAGEGIESFDVLDLHSHLVDKSLVALDEQGEQARYRMLETIRQYAREKLLESGEGERVRDRHLDFFLRLAEMAEPALRGPNQKIWLERLDLEQDNFRAALNWSLEKDAEAGAQLAGNLFWFWHTLSYWSEGREWYVRLLSAGSASHGQMSLSASARAQVLCEAGWLAINDMKIDQALALSEEGLTLYRELGDTSGIAMALHTLGWIAYYRNDHDRARTLANESLARYRELGFEWRMAQLLNLLGNIAKAQGDAESAVAYLKESLTYARHIGDMQGIAYSLFLWGHALWSQGDLTQAAPLVEESLTLAREVRLEWVVAYSLNMLGDVARVQGDFERATALYQECESLWERLGNIRELAGLRPSQAWLARLQGNYSLAAERFREGLTLWQEVGDKRRISACLEGLAGVAVDLGRVERAGKIFGSATLIREVGGVPLPPAYRANYDNDIGALRAQLTARDFNAVWEAGRALTMEQAIEYALRDET